MALVNPNGTVSPDFRVTLRPSEFLAVQADGRVLVRNERGMGRLRTDGQPEPGFQVELGSGSHSSPVRRRGSPARLGWIPSIESSSPAHSTA